jgi:hypothetical protein
MFENGKGKIKNVPKIVENNKTFIKIAHEFLENNLSKERLQETGFIDMSPEYKEEQVKKDIEHLNERSGQIYQSEIELYGSEGAELMKQVTQTFEYLLYYQIKEGHWLDSANEQFSVTLPTAYDDIVNGVDLIIEKKPSISKGEYGQDVYGAAIDVTYSSDETTLQKKLANIEGKIVNASYSLSGQEIGKIPQVKYYKSNYFNKSGRVENLANMVAGASYEHVLQSLQTNFLQQLKTGDFSDLLFEKKEEIDPMHLMLLEQIFAQSVYFKIFSASNRNKELTKKYLRLSNCVEVQIKQLFNNLVDKKNYLNYINQDKSYQALMSMIEKKYNNLLAKYPSERWREVFGSSTKRSLRAIELGNNNEV